MQSAKTQLSSAREHSTAYKAYADQTDLAAVNSAADAVDAAQLSLETAQSATNSTAGKRTVTAPASSTIVVMNAVEGAAVGFGAGAGAAATATSATCGSSGALITIGDLADDGLGAGERDMDISGLLRWAGGAGDLL